MKISKEKRLIDDPLSMRFEDWPDLVKTWGIFEKLISIVFFPIWIFLITYTLLCEAEYFIKYVHGQSRS